MKTKTIVQPERVMESYCLEFVGADMVMGAMSEQADDRTVRVQSTSVDVMSFDLAVSVFPSMPRPIYPATTTTSQTTDFLQLGTNPSGACATK